MNYDEHEVTSGPGPIAAEDWFENNLKRVLQVVPKQKLICAIGNYGYDWTMSIPAKGRHRPPKVLNWIASRFRMGGRRLPMRMRRFTSKAMS